MDEEPKLSYLDWLEATGRTANSANYSIYQDMSPDTFKLDTTITPEKVGPLLDRLVGSLNTDPSQEPEKGEEESKIDKVLKVVSGVNFDENAAWRNGELQKTLEKHGLGLSDRGAAITGTASKAISATTQLVDEALMGDNNFSAQSEVIDTTVHGISSALMKSGNPYALAGAAALEVANFATKALGDTVQGFDVDIDSSGYSSSMGHMDSKSYRNFGALIGMPFLNNKSMARKLQKRNEKARMALAAADIAEEQKYEQTARANSIQNTMLANQIALAGGTDLSLLAN